MNKKKSKSQGKINKKQQNDFKKNGKAKIIKTEKENYITLITCNQAKKGYQTMFIGKLESIEKY